MCGKIKILGFFSLNRKDLSFPLFNWLFLFIYFFEDVFGDHVKLSTVSKLIMGNLECEVLKFCHFLFLLFFFSFLLHF